MKTIQISNLKHIKRLEFGIPNTGVYLLCGANGSGKSSLLACLLRIGSPNAFSYFFRTSTVSNVLDQHEGAEVTYAANGRQVTYSYGGKRWVPKPKANGDVLQDFGFPSVIYVGANSSRIEPRPEDFSPQRIRDAPVSLKNAAEKILGDSKFQDLRRINVRRGVGAEAFLLLDKDRMAENNNVRNYYFSERNFSLGELCVLKLLRDLESCAAGSLLLIDELELALHPLAQIELLRHLERLSIEKRLTVIFSTHSPSLIKSVDRKQIIAVTKGDGQTVCTIGAYPAFALGTLANADEIAPDRAIAVEDVRAKSIVVGLVNGLLSTDFAENVQPTIAVFPVGPFSSVVDFLRRQPGIIPARTRLSGLLDNDVSQETLANFRQNNNFSELAKFQAVEGKLFFLPWTPEVGIANLLRTNLVESQRNLRRLLGDQRVQISNIEWNSMNGLVGGPLRRRAKVLVDEVSSRIMTTRGCERTEADRILSQYFVTELLADPVSAAQMRQLLLPIIR